MMDGRATRSKTECGVWDTSKCAGTPYCPPRCPRFVDTEGTPLVVRPYRDVDHGSLLEMYVALDDDHRTMQLPPKAPEAIEAWIASLTDGGLNLVAVDGTRVVGHVAALPKSTPDLAFDPSDPSAELEFVIFVHGDYHGRGIGTELLKQLVAHATAEGYDALSLFVARSNRRAVSVYRNVHFAIVERRQGELEMVLPLSHPVAERVQRPPAERHDAEDEEPIPAEAASAYETLAGVYGGEYYRSVAEDVAGAIDGGRILDLGTGPGYLPPLLADRTGLPVDAIDATPALVHAGRDRVGTQAASVEFLVGDAYDIPVTGETYSLVVSTGVLHALHHPVEALDEMYRVLGSGGEAWVRDPAVLEYDDEVESHLDPTERDYWRDHLDSAGGPLPETYSPREARALAEASRFPRFAAGEAELGDLRLRLYK